MITFRKLFPEAEIPQIATVGSACADAFACLLDGQNITSFNGSNQEYTRKITGGSVNIHPGERVLIPLGWAVKMPKDVSMRIYSRSGLALKQGIVVANGEGIVDSDYRNPVYAIIGNMSSRWATITHGTRICQIEFVKRESFITSITPDIEDSEWFDTERTGGFGSTGLLTVNANGDTLH